MIYSKSVVLSSVDNSLKKAVLKIDSQSGNVSGEVKLYNFKEEPMGVLTLGLLVDGKVQKAGLNRVGYMSYNFGSILTKIPSSCSCALISSRGGASEPLLIGSINQNNSNVEENLLRSLTTLDCKNIEQVEEILDENGINYEEKEEIESEIDKCFGKTFEKINNEEKYNFNTLTKNKDYIEKPQKSCESCFNCDKCEYKKVFYSEEENETENIPQDLQKDITKGKMRVPNESINFIDEISTQLDLLFEKYPVEDVLMNIIPNSKWVKIDFNKDKRYYVVGLIYEDEKIKYVCYGIPAKWTENPPADFNEKAQWLPIDLSNTHGEGYWLTYQDAVDGDLIEVNII